LGAGSTSPTEIIFECISTLQREAMLCSTGDLLEESARLRAIISIETQRGLTSDGFIQPLGSSPRDGFRVVLREEAASNRQRFTLAHEICHTFFYEAAPEIKFSDHREDSVEESLCNIGAACLLVPETAVREMDAASQQCLASLEALARQFKVSHETMFLRLRNLGHWKSEYSCWHRMTGGDFALERLYGWNRIRWNWADPGIPEKAWHSGRLHRGEAVLWGETAAGDSTAKVVKYEIRRRGELLMALWDERKLYEERPPLLEPTKRPSGAKQKSAVQTPTIDRGVGFQPRYWWREEWT